MRRRRRLTLPILSNTSSPSGQILVGTLVTRIRNAEAQLRQREKLSALGKLSAGLAHELNNPAAAVARAAEQLSTSLDQLLAAGPVPGFNNAERQQAVLARLRQELEAGERSAAQLDPLTRSEREEELAAALVGLGAAEPWELAPPLVAAGADGAWVARARDALGDAAAAAALPWLAHAADVVALLRLMRESAGRISSLVGAVKAYTYMDQAPLQVVDVHAGIESTLAMLAHQMRGVRVVRAYAPDLPPVCAYGSELNQVWTNLLDNAGDALGGQGSVTICTARDGSGVMVEISDDGPGIPPEVQRRLFEPFVTTKPVGEGTGLGLDTVYRIVVTRHRGEVRVSSRPGATIVRVWLPLEPPTTREEGATE